MEFVDRGNAANHADGRGDVAIGIDDVASSSNMQAAVPASAGEEEPLLCRLARCGDKLALEQALTCIPDPSARRMIVNQKSGRSGVSPLHLAAVHGHAEAVKCLLDHKADVDIADEENGNTPLHLAVMMGRLPVAEELVRAGAHLCKMNKEGMMPVSYCRMEDDDMLETLLQHFPNFYSVRGTSVLSQDDARASVLDRHKKTILHYAARYGKSAGNISRLLDCWAGCGDLLDEEEDYNTFLAEAVKAGNAEAVKAVRKFGFLPAAQPSKYHELLSCVLLAPQNSPGSIKKAELVLRELLELGVPTGFDESRLTIESLIVDKLKHELERTSVREVGDDARPPPPPPPPHDYISSGQLYTNELTDPDVSNFSYSLPTYLALYAKRHLAFEFMLQRAPVLIVNQGDEKRKQAPAVTAPNQEDEKRKRAAPALTVNQWDEKRKRTCLHWAVEHRRRDIVEKLLGMKDAALLSPSLEDIEGKTALQLAFESKQQEVRRRMLEGRPAFKSYEEKLSKDREVYTAATNAILVGAVLVASVTYSGFLQPPGDKPEQFKRQSTKVFWAANSLAFLLSLATVFVGIGALLPTPKKYVASIVRLLRGSLVLAASLLALSLVLALAAFSAAGYAAIPHEEYPTYRASISGTISSGGVLCAATFLSFAYQLYKLLPSLAVMAKSLHCGPVLSRFAPDPDQLVGRVGSSTRDGFSNLPSAALHQALRQTLAIPKRQPAPSSSSCLRTFIHSSSPPKRRQ